MHPREGAYRGRSLYMIKAMKRFSFLWGLLLGAAIAAVCCVVFFRSQAAAVPAEAVPVMVVAELPEDEALPDAEEDTEEDDGKDADKDKVAEKKTPDTKENDADKAEKDTDTTTSESTVTTQTPAASVPETPVVSSYSGSYSVDRVFELVNQHRANNGLSALTLDSTLSSAAAVRAQETTISFSHTRPNGSAWYTVTTYVNGENLVMGTGMDADSAVSSWMASPAHRDCMLDGSFKKTGIAYCQSGSEIYWVQLFSK